MSTASFGNITTPHMLRQRHRGGRWHAPEIVPFGEISMSPLAKGINYGQSVFEGMKAYRSTDGDVALFRPRDHLRRLQRSAARLCMPPVDISTLLPAMLELIRRDDALVPAHPGSLYVRPVLFASEATLMPCAADEFELVVALCPVQDYIAAPDGLRLATCSDYVRAAPGGTGSIKCAGNYAAAMPAIERARRDGFDEALWLDAVERRWLEEAGSMNLLYVRHGLLLSPPDSDTVLPGITHASLSALAHESGLEVGRERLSIDAHDWHDIEEVLACGTAAGLMSVREVVHDGARLFSRESPGPVYHDLANRLTAARFGHDGDPRGWRVGVGSHSNALTW